jgi:hypothetical protein
MQSFQIEKKKIFSYVTDDIIKNHYKVTKCVSYTKRKIIRWQKNKAKQTNLNNFKMNLKTHVKLLEFLWPIVPKTIEFLHFDTLNVF